MYIVIWKGTHDKKWSVDGIYEDQVIAEARLRLEELEHPGWKHALVVAEAPIEEEVLQGRAEPSKA